MFEGTLCRVLLAFLLTVAEGITFAYYIYLSFYLQNLMNCCVVLKRRVEGTMSSESQGLSLNRSSSSPIPSPCELQSFDPLGSPCFQMPESQVFII